MEIKLQNVKLSAFKYFLEKSLKLANKSESIVQFTISEKGIESLMLPTDSTNAIKRWCLPSKMISNDTEKIIYTTDYDFSNTLVKCVIRNSNEFIKTVLPFFDDNVDVIFTCEKYRNEPYEDASLNVLEAKRIDILANDFKITKSCANVGADFGIIVGTDNDKKVLNPDDVKVQLDFSQCTKKFRLNKNELENIIKLSNIKTNLDTENANVINICAEDGGLYIKTPSFCKRLHDTDIVLETPIILECSLLHYLCKESYDCYVNEGTIIFNSISTDTTTALVTSITLDDDLDMDDFDNSDAKFDAPVETDFSWENL